MWRSANSFAKHWTWFKSCIAGFSRPPAPDISPTTRALFLQQQSFIKNNAVASAFSKQDAMLLRTLQARFPIVGVFSPPAMRPAIQFSPSFLRAPTSCARGLRTPTGSQLRTIITNPASFGHQTTAQAAQRCLTQYQYPAFARNFSTAKAPTLFQPVNAQANVFANLAAKPFSAINQKGGCLLTHNNATPEPVALKVGRLDADESSNRAGSNGGRDSSKCGGPKLNPAATEQGNIGLYASCAEPAIQQCAVTKGSPSCGSKRARLVRRGSKHISSNQPRPLPFTGGAAAAARTGAQSDRDGGRPRLVDTVAANPGKTKPPDQRKRVYVVMRFDPSPAWDQMDIDDYYDDGGTGSRFTSLRHPDRPRQLTETLVSSLKDVAERHQRRIASVLGLLRQLSQHGAYTVEEGGGVIRVRLDGFEGIEAAREWLSLIGVDTTTAVDTFFTLELHDNDDAAEEEEQQQPQHQHATTPVSSGSSTASSPSSSIILVPRPPAPPTELGPDYFNEIHAFLDHVDDLIESSPAFNNAAAVGQRISLGRS